MTHPLRLRWWKFRHDTTLRWWRLRARVARWFKGGKVTSSDPAVDAQAEFLKACQQVHWAENVLDHFMASRGMGRTDRRRLRNDIRKGTVRVSDWFPHA
jgi:hypothetical protein